MTEAERAVQAKRKSIEWKDRRHGSERHSDRPAEGVPDDVYMLEELCKWQEFFRNDANALAFFEKLDREHSFKKGSA